MEFLAQSFANEYLRILKKTKMKKSIAYLPKKKQEELKSIVKYVLEELPDCEMIILYGSYARNTYVDYDQRVEYGVRTCFMSDYDILVVTNHRFADYIIDHILNKAMDRFYNYKSLAITPSIQFIDESIKDLNKAIDRGLYFYTDIKKEGVMLYDSGNYKLARRRKLNYTEIRDLAQEYFDEKYHKAGVFMRNAVFNYSENEYLMSSFMLHQTCENYYLSVILTFTLYSAKEHNLKKLSAASKAHFLEIAKAFPQDTEEEKRLFKLLVDAYVQARYNKQFVVTREDIEALLPKVKLLGELTKRCCEERMKEYEAMIKQKR